MKLGKLPHKHDPRTLGLAAFVSSSLVPPPSCDWSMGTVAWPEHLNLELGCCAIADCANGIAVWTGISQQREIHITDEGIESAYEGFGYNPADPSTDQGCIMLDVLKAWRKSGLWGHTIDAFALVDHARADRVMAAIWLFGGLGLGFSLPAYVEGRDSWETDSSVGAADRVPGSWGGHAVRCVAYDQRGVIVISWGKLIHVSWEFFLRYCDEAWCAVSCDWLDATGHSPNGFDRLALLNQARAVGQIQP